MGASRLLVLLLVAAVVVSLRVSPTNGNSVVRRRDTSSSNGDNSELNFRDMMKELFRGENKASYRVNSNYISRPSKRQSYPKCFTDRNECYCYSRYYRDYYCCKCLDDTCFPGDSSVQTESEPRLRLSQLRLGHRVLAATPEGALVYSPVIAFLDRRPNVSATYVNIETEDGRNVLLSGSHVIFKGDARNDREARYADEIQPGDRVFIPNFSTENVTSIRVSDVVREIKRGAYVPLTEEGTLFVDGVLTSCYASFDHTLSHLVLAPVRWAPGWFESRESQFVDGVRGYVRLLKWLGRWLLPFGRHTTSAVSATSTYSHLASDILYKAFYCAVVSM